MNFTWILCFVLEYTTHFMIEWVNPTYMELNSNSTINVPSLRLVFLSQLFWHQSYTQWVQSVNILHNHVGRGGIPNDYMITGGGGGLKRTQKWLRNIFIATYFLARPDFKIPLPMIFLDRMVFYISFFQLKKGLCQDLEDF